jgi:hypothetical protein
MAPGVVDAARWLSAEAAQMTSRNAPMDSMDFSPPVHAFTHAPAFAQVHCNMRAVLLHKDGSNQGNLEESLLACNFFRGYKGGNKQLSERLQQSHRQQHQPFIPPTTMAATATTAAAASQQQQQAQRPCGRCSEVAADEKFFVANSMLSSALIPPAHVCAQRLRGGGSSDGGSSDNECTPDARRVVAADRGTPVRAARRQGEAKELAEESEAAAARTGVCDVRARALGAHGDGAETAWGRETTEAREERRRGKVARQMAAQTAARAPGSGVSGTAARDATRSEHALGNRKAAKQVDRERRRAAKRAAAAERSGVSEA